MQARLGGWRVRVVIAHTEESMELYLLRHGMAEQRSETGRDVDRRLTTDGIRGLERALARAREAGARPSLILCSPYRRAVETAEIAARVLEVEGEIVECGGLTPDSAPEELWDEIRVFPDQPAILVAAHEPLLSMAAAWLLGGSRGPDAFHPAGMVAIDFAGLGPEPRGVIRWDFRASS